MTTKELNKLREAIADYIRSEGCSCCEGSNHRKDKAVLGELLKVPMYKDKSGYNFGMFESKK